MTDLTGAYTVCDEVYKPLKSLHLLSPTKQAGKVDPSSTTPRLLRKNMFTKQQLALSLLGWSQSVLALPKAGATPSSSSGASLSSVSLSGPSIVNHPASEAHSSYSGTPTTTGALRASSVLGSSVPSLGVAPGATDYPSDGQLHAPQPAPYTPAGGVGTDGTAPVYNAKSDFDFESLVRDIYLW